MKRIIEILAKAAGTDEKTITDNSDIYWITPEQALEAMKRFGELAFTAGFFYANKEDNIWSTTHHMYDEWLKEQEEE